ncbi:carbonic anhydrase [Campylobacter sp. BCW_6879]|nr:carbonic anhydrase [Campylobacter sp. BCW_6879]
MLINQTFEIDSCDDEELGIGRISKLEYRISYDDEKDIKAIVFMVGGFGSNQNISFLDFDREYIAKKFDVVVVNVFYHCFCHRQSTESKYSASVVMQDKDIRKLKSAFDHFGINFEHDGRNIKDSLACLEDMIQTLKKQNKINQDFKLSLTGTLVPPNGEYQNFGIMAAIDHINALKDLVKRFPKFADLPKIYGGGSYGGYLSLLIAKIAPWYVDGVIDNSGTVLPLLASIIGGDINTGDFVFRGENIDLLCSTISHWTRMDDTSPYFFGNENYMIRALLNSSHLQIQAKKNNNIIFVGYHSAKDEFQTSKDKETLFEIYKALGYDATLHLIKDESEIDGKFIKDLKHGMRIGNKALFRKELSLMLEKLQGRKSFMQESSISYPCGDKVFAFKDVGDTFELVIIN